MEDNRNPDLVNPGWKRRPDWPYPEDFDSPAWKRRMAVIDADTRERRRLYGFFECPKCGTIHTAKTLSCRGCEHKAPQPQKEGKR